MDFQLTRFVFQRALGAIYLVGFLIALNQFRPLSGENGLSPATLHGRGASFWELPGVFWFRYSDRLLVVVAWVGILLSTLAVTSVSDRFGFALSIATWSLLWFLYLSIVNVGGVFYGFGWEVCLLEVGFLAIFLGPMSRPTPVLVIYLLRWVLFRLMFGAGLIKLRGDPCWRDLTCMLYHYETQPLPNPLSWYFHRLPVFMHKAAVLFNHFVELPVPFGFFFPGPVAAIAGALTVVFQLILILSGNLSWLNWLTLVLCIPCFDDRVLSRLFTLPTPIASDLPLAHKIAAGALAALVLSLSYRPARNLFSRRQVMNSSFDPFHLVNTYGAFGSITRERFEIVIEGTEDDVITPSTKWREYEFKGKPGTVSRRPCLVSPYHYKLDWQMWFAAMSSYRQHPWILSLVVKLLENDAPTLALMAGNPFPGAPPRRIRARRFLYEFAPRGSSDWWRRAFVEDYLPPISLRQLNQS